VALAATTIIAEIIGGMMFGSMALVADGWHRSTHAGALAISALTCRLLAATHDERLSHVIVEVHTARDGQGPQAA
jgi:Co/Zn/Cd efflux system component